MTTRQPQLEEEKEEYEKKRRERGGGGDDGGGGGAMWKRRGRVEKDKEEKKVSISNLINGQNSLIITENIY